MFCHLLFLFAFFVSHFRIMATPTKKRRVISLELKKKLIDSSQGKSIAQLGEQFDLPRGTVQTILSGKESILKAINEGGEGNRLLLKSAKHEKLEEVVLRWVKSVRSQNVSITGPLIMEKALELSQLFNIQGFKASDGWLTNFKNRHSISFRTNQGEAGEINLEELGNWQQTLLLQTISQYSPNDVFNADETGLFWQLLPNKTLAFKGERCTSGKKSKERITVLVGSNMSGTEKLPLLIIGKSAKRRCFKNVQLPVDYKFNKKAWMTADIFESWLKEWDKKLKCQNRKILLFLDNFSGHSNIKLEQISLKFFPPNTTAKSQPMDQGIIENLKVHYRRFLLRERLSAIDDNREYKINLLKSLHFLRRSWDSVKPETLKRCFRKSGFVINEPNAAEPLEQHSDTIDEELRELWNELKENNDVEGTLAEYLIVDQELLTGGNLTLAEIADDVLRAELEEIEENSEDELEIEEPEQLRRTTREAKDALRILQDYAEQNTTDPAVLQLCYKIDDILAKNRLGRMHQKKIFEYFV